jgi:hypothetical protein
MASWVKRARSSPRPATHDPDEAAIVANQAKTIIEADDGYQTDNINTATTSLSSSVRDCAFENGQRYHKFREGRYAFPNDEGEQQREDMKHAMIVNLCGGKRRPARSKQGHQEREYLE